MASKSHVPKLDRGRGGLVFLKCLRPCISYLRHPSHRKHNSQTQVISTEYASLAAVSRRVTIHLHTGNLCTASNCACVSHTDYACVRKDDKKANPTQVYFRAYFVTCGKLHTSFGDQGIFPAG